MTANYIGGLRDSTANFVAQSNAEKHNEKIICV
jgi:hypothetical protein